MEVRKVGTVISVKNTPDEERVEVHMRKSGSVHAFKKEYIYGEPAVGDFIYEIGGKCLSVVGHCPDCDIRLMSLDEGAICLECQLRYPEAFE